MEPDFYRSCIDVLLFPNAPSIESCDPFPVIILFLFYTNHSELLIVVWQNTMDEVEYLGRCKETLLAEYWVIVICFYFLWQDLD